MVSLSSPNWVATPHDERGMGSLLRLLGGNPAQEAAHVLAHEARPVFVGTGFSVRGKPETDGPPGALVLLDALTALGKRAILATYAELGAILRTLRPGLEFFEVPVHGSEVVQVREEHALLTVEVCGRTESGAYLNMRGADISDVSPDFESVFGFQSLVSVGDGGNEFGMGSAPDEFFRATTIIKPLSRTRVLVPASVSNYGAYAIVRELEIATGQALLPSPEEHCALIRHLVAFGCVDGFTGERTEKVDGKSLDETDLVLQALCESR